MAHHILIVDDQKEVSRLLRSALETIEQGLTVLEAPSGEEAILESAHKKIDLLIADFRLPGITGVELVRKFRSRNPDVKVIFITGVTEPGLLKEMDEVGADAYFTKPVPMADFLDSVERMLGLVRTILPTSSKADVVEERKTLADKLVEVRKKLNAQAVLLLNTRGHVEAEAGELPDPNSRVSLVSSLMGMYAAAQKVASLLNRAETHLHLFDSGSVDGIFLPIGPSNGLLVVGQGIANVEQLPNLLGPLFESREEIITILRQLGLIESLPGVSAINEPLTGPLELSSDFEKLLKDVGKKKVDANAFWDAAIQNGTPYTEPDKLTYEQASRLGLTPDSAEE